MAGLRFSTRSRLRHTLCALLLLAATQAHGRADQSLDAQLAELSELARFVPEKALRQLSRLQPQIASASLDTQAEFLSQMSVARRGLGQQDAAIALADELIALGRDRHDDAAKVRGMLAKGEVMLIQNALEQSHQLFWEGEKIAAKTADLPLRVQAGILSGQAYAEDGNFPAALTHLQTSVALARQQTRPVQMIQALNALARLYRQMKEYDKGYEALKEATDLATEINSPARMATLLNTDYLFAMDTGRPAHGFKSLLSALELQRQVGDTATIDITLVNLSDSYLKEKNFSKTLVYAKQAIDASRRLNDEAIEATAYVNIGEALLGMGRLAESKRNFETGLALYEKAGDKPALQAMLLEYGDALEQAGDMAGAVNAYHRERTLSNALFAAQRQKALWELQGKYEADKKERRIELLSRENQVNSAEIANRRLQQRIWWLLAAVVALGAVVVGLLYRKIRHANAQLQVKNLELKQQSSRDPLTALYNRRHYQDFMRTHAQAEQRNSAKAGEEQIGALFLLDVDHFKQINDTHGHAAGDEILKTIADNLRVILRETDMIVRWGGEEFLAFLPAVARNRIDDVARRLLTGISSQAIDYHGTSLSVNVSIGYAPFPLMPAGQALSWERTVNLADMALYLAKGRGRNRAYGIKLIHPCDPGALEAIEQDLEGAWRAGTVELSIVLPAGADVDMASEAESLAHGDAAGQAIASSRAEQQQAAPQAA